MEGIVHGMQGRQDLKGETPDIQVEEHIQWSIPYKDSPVEGIIQGIQERQDLKGELQWSIPYKDSPVEGIAQGMHGRQDLKGEPPDRHVEEHIQWSIPTRTAQWRVSSMACREGRT